MGIKHVLFYVTSTYFCFLREKIFHHATMPKKGDVEVSYPLHFLFIIGGGGGGPDVKSFSNVTTDQFGHFSISKVIP